MTAAVVLVPMTAAEFGAWIERAIPQYAQDKVDSGQWTKEASLALSRQGFEELLPQGLATPDNVLFSVRDAATQAGVGMLWFAVEDRAGQGVAYVYDFLIEPQHRRQGYGTQTFQALEAEVEACGLAGIALHVFGHNEAARAFYARLGYRPTNLHLFKAVPAAATAKPAPPTDADAERKPTAAAGREMQIPITIEAVAPESPRQLDEFFAYLREHAAENGSPGAGYFQALPRDASRISAERESHFRAALEVAVPGPGWRRLWMARWPDGRIAGHVDLRAHAEPCSEHRCVLGMGVHRASRRRGVGSQLLEHVRQWASAMAGLEWIDLQVLSVNAAARRLYDRAGYVGVGEVQAMFKVDGQSFAATNMSLRLVD